tara:strand:- start:167 stop:427 length:261 start_codon:yes stop_codon:yes gene_type:complete
MFSNPSEIVRNIRRVKKRYLGWIALVAIQELIKYIVNDKHDFINQMDGNADNSIELDGYLKRVTLEKSGELYFLIKTAQRLLKYGQ